MNETSFLKGARNPGRLMALGFSLLLLLGALSALPTRSDAPQVVLGPAATATPKAVLTSLEDSFSAMAQRVEPGVVSVTSVQNASLSEESGRRESSSPLEDFFKDLFRGDFNPPEGGRWDGLRLGKAATVTAAGSGTIVRRKGDDYYVLTNYHVVQDAYRVAVRLADDTDLKGTVVGVDPTTDLAVVRISSPKLSDKSVVPLGDSNDVKVGSWALAVGSPFGFEHTLTLGVISAVQRELDEGDTVYLDLIQTDAAINKGNSGGPLLDAGGRVIGINAAIASPTGGSVGLGFAIPINTAKLILDDLINNGRVVRGWLGTGVQSLTPVLGEYYGVKQGVLIASTDPRGPASKAGIESEDVVVAVGNTAINDIRQLQRLIAATPPGTTLPVQVVHQGRVKSVNVDIGLLPSTPKDRPSPPPAVEGPGLTVRTLSSELANRIGMKGLKGVIVVDVTPGSAAEDGGLEEGDVIVSFLGRGAESEKQFSQLMKSVRPGQVVVLKIVRKGTTRIIGFRAE